MPWYCEPCGIDSSYYRVSIRAVKEGVITEDQLLDAFIRSANSETRPPVEPAHARQSPSLLDSVELSRSFLGAKVLQVSRRSAQRDAPLVEEPGCIVRVSHQEL